MIANESDVLLTGEQMAQVYIVYCKNERETHKADIKKAEGKVTELDEFILRLENTCFNCGEFIYPSFRPEEHRMFDHMATKHPK